MKDDQHGLPRRPQGPSLAPFHGAGAESRGSVIVAVLIVAFVLIVGVGAVLVLNTNSVKSPESDEQPEPSVGILQEGVSESLTESNAESINGPETGSDPVTNEPFTPSKVEGPPPSPVAVPQPPPPPPPTPSPQAQANYIGTILAGDAAAPLLDFNQADYETATASGDLVALYFFAEWCPLCAADFPKMESAFDQVSGDDVVGFRVNYKDSNTDAYEQQLAQDLNVPYQQAKIFLRNGQIVSSSFDAWPASRWLDTLNSL